MRPSFRLLIAAAMSLPLLLQGGEAAASAACERLQGRLAAMPRTVPDTVNMRKYASAIASQNLQLRKVRTDMRRLGCSSGSITVYGGPNAATCDMLASTAGKMERNLQVLDKKRSEFATAGNNQNARRRILTALEANGCNDTRARVTPVATGEKPRGAETHKPGLLPLDAMPEGNAVTRLRSLGGTSGNGRLRTVCVRTCDGGFFPISDGATPLDFRRDQQVCAMMCPQTQTELFYHPLSSHDAEGMISSVTGQPYSTLPSAFAYRTRDLSRPGTCGCDLAAYHREMIKRERALSGGGETPMPEDAATGGGQRNSTGSLTTITTGADKKTETAREHTHEERVYDPSTSNVRNIGPVFLPETESAIDLRNPAQSGLN